MTEVPKVGDKTPEEHRVHIKCDDLTEYMFIAGTDDTLERVISMLGDVNYMMGYTTDELHRLEGILGELRLLQTDVKARMKSMCAELQKRMEASE